MMSDKIFEAWEWVCLLFVLICGTFSTTNCFLLKLTFEIKLVKVHLASYGKIKLKHLQNH